VIKMRIKISKISEVLQSKIDKYIIVNEEYRYFLKNEEMAAKAADLKEGNIIEAEIKQQNGYKIILDFEVVEKDKNVHELVFKAPKEDSIQRHIDKTAIFKGLCECSKKGTKPEEIANKTNEVYKILFGG